MESRSYGKIAAWIPTGGFGFIASEDERGEVEKLWWHVSSFAKKPDDRGRLLGKEVSFTILPCKLGKHRTADEIEFV